MKEVSDFLKNNNSNLLLLNGDWGSGKTYFLKNDGLKKIIEIENLNKKIFYLTPEDIEKKTIKEAIFLNDENNKVIKKFSKIPFLKSVSLITDASIQILSNGIDLNDYIIVIDEIERKTNLIDIKEIFNKIFKIKESNKKLKIIISLNKNKLDANDQLLFKSWYDKIVDEEHCFFSDEGLAFFINNINKLINNNFKNNDFKFFLADYVNKNLRNLNKLIIFLEKKIEEVELENIIRKEDRLLKETELNDYLNEVLLSFQTDDDSVFTCTENFDLDFENDLIFPELLGVLNELKSSLNDLADDNRGRETIDNTGFVFRSKEYNMSYKINAHTFVKNSNGVFDNLSTINDLISYLNNKKENKEFDEDEKIEFNNCLQDDINEKTALYYINKFKKYIVENKINHRNKTFYDLNMFCNKNISEDVDLENLLIKYKKISSMVFLNFIDIENTHNEISKKMLSNISSVDLNNKIHQFFALKYNKIIEERLVFHIKKINKEVSLYDLVSFYRELKFIDKNKEKIKNIDGIKVYFNRVYTCILKNNLNVDIDIFKIINYKETSDFYKDCFSVLRFNKSFILKFSEYIFNVFKNNNYNQTKKNFQEVENFLYYYNDCLFQIEEDSLFNDVDKKYAKLDKVQYNFEYFNPINYSELEGTIVNRFFYDVVLVLEGIMFKNKED